jgi:hypothetical protein
VRQSAVEAILERNPNAFRPKIQVTAWQHQLLHDQAVTYIQARH